MHVTEVHISARTKNAYWCRSRSEKSNRYLDTEYPKSTGGSLYKPCRRPNRKAGTKRRLPIGRKEKTSYDKTKSVIQPPASISSQTTVLSRNARSQGAILHACKRLREFYNQPSNEMLSLKRVLFDLLAIILLYCSY